MMDPIGRRGIGAPTAPALEQIDEAWLEPAVDVTAGVEAADEVEASGEAGEPSLEQAWLAPPGGWRAFVVDGAEATAALSRLAARPAAPGEPPAVSRMREVAARYLELRLDVAAGIARVSVG